MAQPKLIEQLLRDLLATKAKLEDEKYTDLQRYFDINNEGDLAVREIGVQIPIVTDEGVFYQTQRMPLLSLFPSQFFKLETLNLSFNAYLRSNKNSQTPQLTLNKKESWLKANKPVHVSMTLSEKDAPVVTMTGS